MPRSGWWSAIGLVALAAGCRRHPDALAVVGGHPVTLGDVQAVVEAQTSRPFAEAPTELVATLFEELLEEEVVLAAAGTAEDRALPVTARGYRVRELLASQCPPPPRPTDQEVSAFLAEHPEMQPAGERIRLRQLILPDEAGARAARERVRRGEEFAAVSRELSRAPNAAEGGTLGWLELGQLPPDLEAAVFRLAAGAVSEPVASNAGWHVFQVVERRSTGGAPDPGVVERARAELGGVKAEASRRECVRRLAARVGVEVRGEGAPFACRNPFEGV